MQHFTKGQGYGTGPLDGLWGPLTQAAISDYKNDVCNLNHNGNVRSDAWECLRNEIDLVASIGPDFFFDIDGFSITTANEYNLGKLRTSSGTPKWIWSTQMSCNSATFVLQADFDSTVHSTSCI